MFRYYTFLQTTVASCYERKKFIKKKAIIRHLYPSITAVYKPICRISSQ